MLDVPVATMVLVRWTGNSLWQRLRSRIDEECFILRLTYWSLVFNSLTSCNTAIDTALEPLFWFVDHFVKYLGPAFVLIVICLVLSVVLIFYVCLLPEKYAESVFWTVYHLAVGHWLLINVTFHYFKAVFTDPGHPPENTDSKWKYSDDEDELKIPEVVSICKKCISPKPPRAHHCSVCKTCVLKMDHHCPWLNNCVGHYNHRYFFLFCVYMWLGTVYVSISAYPVFKEHFLGSADVSISGYFYPIYMMQEMWAKHYQEKYHPNATLVMKATRSPAGYHFHNFVLYEFLLCSAVSVALGLLMMWHARLISRGETSIEVHINKKEKKRLAKVGQTFHNPYSFGTWRNWQKFLGITHGRTFWRHVLLPSSHIPESDGLTWHLANLDPNPSGLTVL